MNEYNIKVDFTKGKIFTNLKKLVQNDYNSTKLNFTFDKEGRVLFKLLYPDGTQYVDEIVNNELVFGPGILNQEGTYEYEIALYTEDGRLTDYATKTFEVRSELVNTDELVTPDDRVPVLDKLIDEVNTIKQDIGEGEGSSILTLDVNSKFTEPSQSFTDEETLLKCGDIINKYYKMGVRSGKLLVRSTTSGIVFFGRGNQLTSQLTTYYFSEYVQLTATTNKLCGVCIIGTWSNDIFTCTNLYAYTQEGGTFLLRNEIRELVINILKEYNLISSDSDLTEEQITAINEMVCEMSNNGELNITYDDTILDFDFSIENGELIVEDNEENIELTINENKEMEAIY